MSPAARRLRPRIVALTLAALMAEAVHIVAEGESVVLNAYLAALALADTSAGKAKN